MTLTAKDVADITRLLEESSFDELYLELDGLKLSVRRGAAAARHEGGAGPVTQQESLVSQELATSGASAMGMDPMRAPSEAAPAPPQASATASVTLPAAAANPNIQDVSSPLLGTFYRAPKPGAPPFVEIGSPVEEDTVIGIIEVMKLMNTVRAGVRGNVTEILTFDGVLVETGETLMRVRKSA